MDDVTFARALHVLVVVLWIGGVAFVTTVLLPAVRDLHAPGERVVFFETVERRFGNQARVTTVLAGLSGLLLATPAKHASFSACAPLTAEEQKRLAAITRTINIAPHCSIFDEADPAEYVYTITAGTVKVYKLLGDGRRQITGFLFAGDFLGLIHNEAYAYSAEALVPTKLCRFPRRRLEALLVEIPHLEQRLLAMASHELAAAQDQMVLLGRKSARERVVSFILMLSNSATRHGRPGDPVFLGMSRGDIADYLGLTTETVSRTLTSLKKQGLIELLDEKRIRLSKMSVLREIAEGF